MTRVYIGCFGSGLGHASRMLDVAARLKEMGATVEFSSSGEVAFLLRRNGYRCNEVPLADVKYKSNGEFSTRETLLASPSILAKTALQVGLEVRNIARFGAGAVLSDSALATVLAAKALRVPVFAVLNQLNLTNKRGGSSAAARLLSVGTSSGMGKLWELSDAVILPDLPPPYTVSEENLWGSRVERTKYVGFLGRLTEGVPDEAARELIADTRTKVFWQVSGPAPTRAPLVSKALECAASLADEFTFVVTGGDPSSSPEPVRVAGGWYYGWCPIPAVYFRCCDVVVSRAGHATIGQAIESGKASLTIPIPRQPEQEGNADKAQRLGVSIKLEQADVSAESVRAALRELSDGEQKERARRLGELASRFDASGEIASLAMKAASTL
jgi:UDP-N-acetylglucosamine--N-acetylmuramyl-(pentapeptide) pyrophosphoryl-undecaprenol N-acetylglucosamine transferase